MPGRTRQLADKPITARDLSTCVPINWVVLHKRNAASRLADGVALAQEAVRHLYRIGMNALGQGQRFPYLYGHQTG